MKLIKPSFEILSQENGIDGMYKMIELAGRTCYKSEDKITEDSSVKFVQMLIDKGHSAMLEHGTVYLKLHWYNIITIFKYLINKYSKVKKLLHITTNYRVLVENNWIKDLKFQCEPTEYHEKRISVRFVCDRGVSHELVRHRVFSFAQESTRYCNYFKDKFGNEITFILPCWIDEDSIVDLVNLANEDNKKVYELGHDENVDMKIRGLCSYIYDMSNSEHGYNFQVASGWQPQQARAILPNSLKTEIVVTGFISDWKQFFKLRCSEAAHPQMRELAIPLKDEFIKSNLI